MTPPQRRTSNGVIVDVSMGPPVVDPDDSCENCGAVVAIGDHVRLVEFPGDYIEQWCSYCASHLDA